MVNGAARRRKRLILRYVELVRMEDKIMVDPPVEVSDLGAKVWDCCLVGHILDVKLPSQVV